MYKRTLIFCLILMFIISGISGCGINSKQEQTSQNQQSTPEEQDKYGGIFRMALVDNPPNINPVHATDVESARIVYQIFETLVTVDEDGNLVPLLAESWETKDSKTYIFNLRKNVHFHQYIEGGTPTQNGGREVTADDWVWSFNYICDPETKSERAYFLNMIKGYQDYREGKVDKLPGVKKIDDYTFKIELEYPFSPFLYVLTYNCFNVLPKEDVNKWGDEFGFHPVGTGPFRFEKWVQDEKIVLSKHENYWMRDEKGNKLPYLKGIEFKVVNDDAVRWTEFNLGNFDGMENVDDPYYLEAKQKYGSSFQERPLMATYFYCMNMEKAPFKGNKKLRLAMNFAVDREKLVELVLNGRATPAEGVLPPGIFAYNPDLEGYSYNPEKAKRLLKEAGYPNGIDITLYYNNLNLHQRVAEALQQQYKAVGINLELKGVDLGAYIDAIKRGEITLFKMTWVADYPDPDNFLYVLFNSKNHGMKGNFARFTNDKVDRLTSKARTEPDPQLRKQLYQQAEEIVIEEAPCVFLFFNTTHVLNQPYVKGYELPVMGDYTAKFTKVWMDKNN